MTHPPPGLPLEGGGEEQAGAVLRYDPSIETFTSERCHIVELSNTPDDPDVSIAQARVEPGVTTRWHRLVGTIERYVIVGGHGAVEIGDLPPTPMHAGDVATIPAMTRQRITNPGPTDLIFLAICTPRFQPSNYEELDEET